MDRREVASRNTSWAKALAKLCADVGLTPNQISVASIFFALFAGISYGLAFLYPNYAILLFSLAIIFIIIKLLCNLFDGMLAIEYEQKSPVGDLYNDVPDRLADLFIYVGAGFSIFGYYYAEHLGWLAGSLAITTAYIRVIGKSLGTQTYFSGPMGKQHRTFVIIVGTLLQIGAIAFDKTFPFIYISLVIIVIGSVITCIRRLIQIKNEIWENSK